MQMPLITPIVMRRGLLAAGGTLLAALVARNSLRQAPTPGPEAPGTGPARNAAPPAAPGPAPRGIADLQPHAPAALPALAFTTADGVRRTLADYAGRGVILNFWATWCTPCVSEMPALDALAGAMAASKPPMTVLAVSLDRAGAAAVTPFYASHGIRNLPVLLDPHSETMMALRLDGIPTTLVIDRGGQEVARIQGPVRWDDRDAAASLQRMAG
ncbi:TlpA family protein disulfide reductase [Lichenicoccus roseus]|uniref:TlpA family protein disulfide reductase n=2 Tax=Lichenicoccus roseus TaxID=2683649 RepID=A0A5R9JDQ1_9PROT|nr:TlpA family protein disulfide reductase [Lichenicoccus roseus]